MDEREENRWERTIDRWLCAQMNRIDRLSERRFDLLVLMGFIIIYILVIAIENRWLRGTTLPFVLVPLMLVPMIRMAGQFRSWRKEFMLNASIDGEAIRRLGWEDFEDLVDAVYRDEGWETARTRRATQDGGVDIFLRRGSEQIIIQCKHSYSKPVRANVVRELKGTLAIEGISHGILVSSGGFTNAARSTADKAGIELVSAYQIAERVQEIAEKPKAEESESLSGQVLRRLNSYTFDELRCSCGGKMMPRQNSNDGSFFWSCEHKKNRGCRTNRNMRRWERDLVSFGISKSSRN